MPAIAVEAGLAEPGSEAAANWTGVLVELGYLTHSLPVAGDRRPMIPGRMWANGELQRFSDYRVTASGREDRDQLVGDRLIRSQFLAISTGIVAV